MSTTTHIDGFLALQQRCSARETDVQLVCNHLQQTRKLPGYVVSVSQTASGGHGWGLLVLHFADPKLSPRARWLCQPDLWAFGCCRLRSWHADGQAPPAGFTQAERDTGVCFGILRCNTVSAPANSVSVKHYAGG